MLKFDSSHDILRKSVSQFVQKEIIPHIDQWEDEGVFPQELYQKVANLGLLKIGFEEGTDFLQLVVAAEELMKAGSQGLVAGLFSHAIALPPIRDFGTRELKEKVIGPVIMGQKISALAITEPDCGSDVAHLKTKAIKDHDFYIVNGAKTFITSGERADFVTCAVRTGGPGFQGISLLVIEKGTHGFEVSRRLKKMGWQSSDTAELSFKDCRVPVSNLIGKENEGFLIIMKNFASERLLLAIMAYSTAELALQKSIEYVSLREAFGKPLKEKQVLRHKIAKMATQVQMAKEFVYTQIEKYLEGHISLSDIAMAKNVACDASDWVVDQAVQIHGGMGYMKECLVERLYRDQRLMRIGGGTYEIMNEIIAREVLD